MHKNKLLFDIHGQMLTSSPFLWLLFSAVPPGEPVCSSMTMITAGRTWKWWNITHSSEVRATMQNHLWFQVLCYLRDTWEQQTWGTCDGRWKTGLKWACCSAKKYLQTFLSVVVLPVLFLSTPPNFGSKIISLAGYISSHRNALVQPLSK